MQEAMINLRFSKQDRWGYSPLCNGIAPWQRERFSVSLDGRIACIATDPAGLASAVVLPAHGITPDELEDYLQHFRAQLADPGRVSILVAGSLPANRTGVQAVLRSQAMAGLSCQTALPTVGTWSQAVVSPQRGAVALVGTGQGGIEPASGAPRGRVSMRAMNPLGADENPHFTFCDRSQAKATTATRFFRSPEMFKALEELIQEQTESGKGRSHPVVWSAGCSTGAEPFSLALVLRNAFDKSRCGANWQVFGTDINPDCIAQGRAGRYLLPSDQLVPQQYRHLLLKHATRHGADIQFHDEIRRHLRFGLFDIRKPPKRHTFDFIVCNHVLQYYDEFVQQQIIQHFLSVLRPGGRLYLEGITKQTIALSPIAKLPGKRDSYIPTARLRQPAMETG